MNNQPNENTNIQHKIVTFRYHLISTLFFVGMSSLLTLIAYSVVIVVFLGMIGISPNYAVFGAILLFALSFGAVVAAHVATRRLPESYRERYLPAWLPLLISLGSWAICYLLAGGSNIAMMSGFITPFVIFNLTYIISVLVAILTSNIWIVFAPPIIFNLIFAIAFTIFERRPISRPKPIDKKFLLVITLVIVLSVMMIFGAMLYRNLTVDILPQSYGYAYGNGYSSVDLYSYYITNPANVLPELDAPSTFQLAIESRFPVLDGAEAAFPVYSAFANACYQFDNLELGKGDAPCVTFTNTIYAFERLVNGEVDIFFGARPSQAQMQLAEDAGVELVMTPIAYEAFVFFVHKDNNVDSLTSDQIRRIYSGKVTNWKDIGGIDIKIMAFQRPENSGSQTLLQYIMGDTKIMKPLIEELIGGMGGITERVASYRDSVTSIGYTFKFFLTGMTVDSENVKMLAIDGIAPTKENISSQKYPYTTNLYAITVADNKLATVAPFIEWMTGEQGQYIIDQIGYVPIERGD